MIIHFIGDWETPFLLDAPVSGGVIAAEAGTLTFMVWLLFYSGLLKIHIDYKYDFDNDLRFKGHAFDPRNYKNIV